MTFDGQDPARDVALLPLRVERDNAGPLASREGHVPLLDRAHRGSGSTRDLDQAAMFIFIGSAPHTAMAEGLLELDEKGYVLTGPDLPRGPADRPRGWPLDRDPYLYETNVPGIFAVGDVRAGSGKRVASEPRWTGRDHHWKRVESPSSVREARPAVVLVGRIG